MNVLRDNGGNGVDCVMSSQAFTGETRHCSQYRLQSFSDLVLNDGMKDGVRGEVGKLGSRVAVVLFDKKNPFLLVEFEPLFWIRCALRVVLMHFGIPSGRTNKGQNGMSSRKSIREPRRIFLSQAFAFLMS